MRIIVTGAAGFVAPYFIRAIREANPNVEIFACARRQTGTSTTEIEYALDITDEAAVSELIAQIKPTHVMPLSVTCPTAALMSKQATQ